MGYQSYHPLLFLSSLNGPYHEPIYFGMPGPLFSPPLQPPPPYSSFPPYLFHYTDLSGMKSITQHNFIRKSFPRHHGSSAYFGEGVYLTVIPPDAPNHVILQNNWNGHHSYNGSKFAKSQFCFAIPTLCLNRWDLHKIFDKFGRDIWVYKAGITLGDKPAVRLVRRW